MTIIEPGYIALFRSGELERRAQALEARLVCCDICPRKCKVNRLEDERGFCRSGRLPIVASVCAHRGEEPVLSGTNGSGTIFFGNCNMRCAYCQNYQISQNWRSQKSNEIQCKSLAENMIRLQDDLKCHNINFVSPSHFVPQIVRALVEAVPMGLHIPIVYNTGGYDSLDTLKELDGIVDIYLPDIRYADDSVAKRYSQAKDYVENNRAAIKEMYRQVGDLVVDENGLARRGLIVRHLILPNTLAGSEESLEWIAKELSPSVTVSVMSQYSPQHKAPHIPLLSRRISPTEYESVLKSLSNLGMENGWIQELESSDHYLPDFERKSHPFDTDPVGANGHSPSISKRSA
ncbi:MAG: radical SAM protein [Dehalococcoidia bacterium]|jgi:putative pyruvate formate lyase activating enzyme